MLALDQIVTEDAVLGETIPYGGVKGA